MRYIGNKEKIVAKLYEVIKKEQITGSSFFDLFAGTTTVAKFFKKKKYKIYSSDLMYFSYVLQKAYIENNKELLFKKVLDKLKIQSEKLFSTHAELVISYLNRLSPKKGFIYRNSKYRTKV